MKVLLDTNIVLDLLLEREAFCNEAKDIFEMIESDKISGFFYVLQVSLQYTI